MSAVNLKFDFVGTGAPPWTSNPISWSRDHRRELQIQFRGHETTAVNFKSNFVVRELRPALEIKFRGRWKLFFQNASQLKRAKEVSLFNPLLI